MKHPLRIRAFSATRDLAWAERLLEAELGGRQQARRGELVDALGSGGLVCDEDDRPVGMICWRIEGGGLSAEITCLAVVEPARRQGIGRALLAAAHQALVARGVGRTWLVTTNDNMTALTLYEKAGYEVVEIRKGAVDEARRTLKPSLARVGEHGIPIRDELELARDL